MKNLQLLSAFLPLIKGSSLLDSGDRIGSALGSQPCNHSGLHKILKQAGRVRLNAGLDPLGKPGILVSGQERFIYLSRPAVDVCGVVRKNGAWRFRYLPTLSPYAVCLH